MAHEDEKAGRSWSAAGPHSEAWRALGTAARQEFNEAARGAETPAEKTRQGDKATHTHDLEPSLQDKKEGAALDKAAAQAQFERYKASRAPEKTRGFDLDR